MAFFSVILPTRNRPGLFERALQSVLGQTFQDREIIAVVDGSDARHIQSYRELESRFPAVRFHYLVHRPDGHGQSYSMNFGVDHSGGEYLCFLDDDDYWTDVDYLTRAAASLRASRQPVDMHYVNQHAYYADGARRIENVWLGDLIAQVDGCERIHGDSYVVDCTFMLRSAGFAHLNCSIFRRGFYDAIGGMDEGIRYENDRDVFIRSVDAAQRMLYSTQVVSRHNIPDGSKHENMSTVSSELDKKLYQMRVYDKGICFCEKPEMVDFCRRGKAYELKHVANILVQRGQYRSASHFAREALLASFNLRWLGFSLFIWLRGFTRGNRAT